MSKNNQSVVQKSSAIVGLEAKGVNIVDDQQEIDVASTADALRLAEVADLEAFMNDPVKVLVMSTTDANAPPYADISVNGIKVVIRRNVPTLIRRMHLEVLARMRETRWVQPELESLKAAGMETLRGHTALCYPFTVLDDPAGKKGGAWLESIFAEAV